MHHNKEGNDTIVDTDCVTNTTHLRLNLIQRIACTKTKYIAGISASHAVRNALRDGHALEFAHNRILMSFLRASRSRQRLAPEALCDLAWNQAQLP